MNVESDLESAQPVRPSTPSPLTTSDDQYLDRLDQTLDVLEAATTPAERATDLKVSVVIPAFNERDTIGEIVDRVQAVGLHSEIVVVDDCSTDGTREVLTELDKNSDVRVFMHDCTRGKGAALRTALREVTGEVVLIQDADLEYDPQDYPRLLAPIKRGEADVVYGSRFLENPHQDPSWLHRFGNRLLTVASNSLTGQRLTDMETCYKVFRREIVDDLVLRQDRFGFEPEITAKLARRGARIVEVPVRYRSRGYDEGKKIGVKDGLNAFYCILRYAWCD